MPSHRQFLLAALLTGCATAAPVATAPVGELPRTHVARPTSGAITPDDLMSRLYTFADDSMMGREAGTRGNVMATDYVAREMARIGLRPAGENGTWFQTVPIFIASMMGVITGIFGGVLRDIVCNEVPMVLRDGKPYAICSFAGCWMYLLMQKSGIPPDFSLWTSALAISVLRLVTWSRGVRLG